MKKIEDREDVFILVTTFYSKIRQDELLGPIFNEHITKEQWPGHLQKLTDFWVTALFGVLSFKGNPAKAHKNIDENLNYSINQLHFGKWLQLWFNTIDLLYEGTIAQRAKDAARKMATSQYIAIWKNRPQNQMKQ